MFSNKKAPIWMYALPSDPDPLNFPPAFSSQLESLYLCLYDPKIIPPTKTIEYNDSKNKKSYIIDLATMKMRESSYSTGLYYKIFRNASSTFDMLGYSLVICRNKAGKFLAVNETQDRGWYLPAGKVDLPETFREAALREAKEEASIDIILKGILQQEYSFICNYLRYRVIFYAEPKDENQPLKNKPDSESLEARWVSLDELKELGKKKPQLRGPELLYWGTYLENGGEIYPMETFQENQSPN